jgi:3-oxoadipate enol-lactonase
MPYALKLPRLWYERSGSGEPLLLITGFTISSAIFDPILPLYEDRFECITYDHRGSGRSGAPPYVTSMPELASDAARLLDSLGIESAHVYGLSMGGMVAQELALRHPERIRTLALGCTYAGGAGSSLTPPETFQRLSESWQTRDRDQILRATWEINVSESFARDDDAYETFRRAALELPVPMKVIMAQLQAIAVHDTSARLRDISAPTLVVHGDQDQMLNVANGRRIAELIPGSRLEVLEGVGHLFWVEEPERSAQLVREHALAGVSS